MIVLARLVSRLPFWALYVLSDLLAWVAYRVVGYRRAVVRANLRRSFPELSEVALEKHVRAFYYNLSDVVVETLKTLTISAAALQRRVRYRRSELIEDELAAGRSVLILASHQSNWEWLQVAWSERVGGRVDAVYKPLTDQRADRLMRAIRQRFGSHLVPHRQLLRYVVSPPTEGRILAVVADQTPRLDSSHRWIDFLHQPTPFFTGTERIAQRMPHKVVYAGMRRLRRGHYEVTLEPISPPHPRATMLDAYAGCVAAAIRQAPADWLWSHRRWKHRPPPATDDAADVNFRYVS